MDVIFQCLWEGVLENLLANLAREVAEVGHYELNGQVTGVFNLFGATLLSTNFSGGRQIKADFSSLNSSKSW